MNRDARSRSGYVVTLTRTGSQTPRNRVLWKGNRWVNGVTPNAWQCSKASYSPFTIVLPRHRLGLSYPLDIRSSWTSLLFITLVTLFSLLLSSYLLIYPPFCDLFPYASMPPSSAIPDFYYFLFSAYEPFLTAIGFLGTCVYVGCIFCSVVFYSPLTPNLSFPLPLPQRSPHCRTPAT